MERIGSYAVSIIIPIVALVVSLITYFDSLQSTLDEVVLQKAIESSVSSGDYQMVAEQLQYRVDMFSQMITLFVYAGYITIFYIFVMLGFYIIKNSFQKRELFLKDYGECISNIRQEKLAPKNEIYIFYL